MNNSTATSILSVIVSTMLQHRQVIRAGDVCAVYDEHIFASDADEDVKNKDYAKFNVVEALSGSITQAAQFSANRSARNARIVATAQHIFQYDYLCGSISVIARKDSRTIAQLNKRPPANTFIATSCASQLHDGMFFYAHGSNSTEEGNTSNLLTSVYAVLVGEDSAVMSLAMHTEYKNSGFTEKNPGRIVSLHCHPSKPFLFVVFSKGTVQVTRVVVLPNKSAFHHLSIESRLRVQFPNRCGRMPSATNIFSTS